MKTLSFNSPFELATWIKSNISCELEQEKLMLQGIRNSYTITVPK